MWSTQTHGTLLQQLSQLGIPFLVVGASARDLVLHHAHGVEIIRATGDIDFGYDIGLPPKTAYACLAETALLAMEGRFEDYTLGRNISVERVKEIYRLFKKHEFKNAGLRSFDEFITDNDLAQKRALAEKYRNDPQAVAECWAGAVTKEAYLDTLNRVGFTSIEVIEESKPYPKGEIEVASFTIAGKK